MGRAPGDVSSTSPPPTTTHKPVMTCNIAPELRESSRGLASRLIRAGTLVFRATLQPAAACIPGLIPRNRHSG